MRAANYFASLLTSLRSLSTAAAASPSPLISFHALRNAARQHVHHRPVDRNHHDTSQPSSKRVQAIRSRIDEFAKFESDFVTPTSQVSPFREHPELHTWTRRGYANLLLNARDETVLSALLAASSRQERIQAALAHVDAFNAYVAHTLKKIPAIAWPSWDELRDADKGEEGGGGGGTKEQVTESFLENSKEHEKFERPLQLFFVQFERFVRKRQEELVASLTTTPPPASRRMDEADTSLPAPLLAESIAHFRSILWKRAPESCHRLVRLLMTLDPSLNQLASPVGSLPAASYAHGLFPLYQAFFATHYASRLALERRLVAAANLSSPHKWFPQARAMGPRRVIFHAGSTNSGKTYAALQALAAAPSGVYCGPLRLLAMEVYDKLNQSIPCDLLTGQERKLTEGAKHVACTVEMLQTDRFFDMCVVDEVQMLGDASRGWAWTRALLGCRVRELHVCGDASALELVRALCREAGDVLEEKRYERMAPLSVSHESLAASAAASSIRSNRSSNFISSSSSSSSPPSDALRAVEPGDCIVAFSRRKIFAIKETIERHTGLKACVVYGALPPETRRRQAQLFNDASSGYNVLVASDAIGMGLNLAIKRVVFFEVQKISDSSLGRREYLTVQHVKQIAGRAGRRGMAHEGSGVVTTLSNEDLVYVKKCMATHPGQQGTSLAGLHPEFDQLELFSQLLAEHGERHDLHHVLKGFVERSIVQGPYFHCRLEGMINIARDIARLMKPDPSSSPPSSSSSLSGSDLDPLPVLSLRDQYSFCMAPLKSNDQISRNKLLYYASQYGKGLCVPFDTPLPASTPIPTTIDHLHALETRYHVVSLWIWLSFRFDEAKFPGRREAEETSKAICALLDQGLHLVRAVSSNQQDHVGSIVNATESESGSSDDDDDESSFNDHLDDSSRASMDLLNREWYIARRKAMREKNRAAKRRQEGGALTFDDALERVVEGKKTDTSIAVSAAEEAEEARVKPVFDERIIKDAASWGDAMVAAVGGGRGKSK